MLSRHLSRGGAARSGIIREVVHTWKAYGSATLSHDGVAALVVTIMLVPQSLAYAMLAGLPPQMGLYASVAPLIAYAVFGSSRTLAVGPVAVVSVLLLSWRTSRPHIAVVSTRSRRTGFRSVICGDGLVGRERKSSG